MKAIKKQEGDAFLNGRWVVDLEVERTQKEERYWLGYFKSGTWLDTGDALTNDELDKLDSQESELLSQMLNPD